MCALGSLIFLLEYSSVYSRSWIQRVFNNGCSRVLEKFVRIGGVYVHTASDAPNSLRNFLLMASWIVNNNKTLLFFYYYIIKYVFYNLLNFHLVDLGEFLIWKVDRHTQKNVGTLELLMEKSTGFSKSKIFLKRVWFGNSSAIVSSVSPHSSQSSLFTW